MKVNSASSSAGRAGSNVPAVGSIGRVRRKLPALRRVAGRAGGWLWSVPWAYPSVAIAGAAIILVIPPAAGLMPYGTWAALSHWFRYLIILGMAAGILDASRSEDRRIPGAIGFCLNVLAFIIWGVASVALHFAQPDDHI